MRMTGRQLWMMAGFVAAGAGDWFLAIKGSPKGSPGFLYGVLCFSLAQLLWMAGQRVARLDGRIFCAAAVPLGLFVWVRVYPELPPLTGLAVCVYALLSAVSFTVALATRRVWYTWGVSLLLISDILIGGRLLHAPGCGSLVGPTYLGAELCLLASFFLKREKRYARAPKNVWPVAVLVGTGSFVLFLLAALCYPRGGYNPLRQMLSVLGRTFIRGIEYPLCHYLFTVGLLLAAVATAHVWVYLAHAMRTGWRGRLLAWGAAANVAGLCAIALIPENVNGFAHNVGCHLAAIGGAGVLFARGWHGADRVWGCVLVGVVSLFSACLLLHAARVIPFSPWVPTFQKLLIVLFAAWVGDIARRERTAPFRVWHVAVLALLLSIALIAVVVSRG